MIPKFNLPTCFFSIKKQQGKEVQLFKEPQNGPNTHLVIKTTANIKQEKLQQDVQQQTKLLVKENQCTSKSRDDLVKLSRPQNPFFPSEDHDDEYDEDLMPMPIKLKQEPESSEKAKKLTIKERFNVDCEECEKVSSS